VSLKNKVSSVDLNGRLGLEEMADIVTRGQLSWFGHLERKGSDDWVSTGRSSELPRSKSTDISVSDKICALRTSRQNGHSTEQNVGAHLEGIASVSMEKWTLNR